MNICSYCDDINGIVRSIREETGVAPTHICLGDFYIISVQGLWLQIDYDTDEITYTLEPGPEVVIHAPHDRTHVVTGVVEAAARAAAAKRAKKPTAKHLRR